MFKMIEDLQRIGRSQMEAASESATALSRGVQQIALEASEFSKTSMSEGSSVFGKLIGVQTFDAAIQVQTDYAKASCESLVAGCSRFGELVVAVAKDASKPFESSFEIFQTQ